jgi:sec-independent protein translocase protein TatB
MFEVGWSEYLVIFGLALVVLGPEKLPKLAASIGRWVGRARTMARQFRDQLESEAGSIRETIHDVQKDFESAATGLETNINDVKQEVETGLQEPAAAPDAHPAVEPAAAADAGLTTDADNETTAELPTPISIPEDSAGGPTPGEAQDERKH